MFEKREIVQNMHEAESFFILFLAKMHVLVLNDLNNIWPSPLDYILF